MTDIHLVSNSNSFIISLPTAAEQSITLNSSNNIISTVEANSTSLFDVTFNERVMQWYPYEVWVYLVTTWSEKPTLVYMSDTQLIYSYTLNGITRYRSILVDYDPVYDIFYSTYSNGLLSDKIVSRG